MPLPTPRCRRSPLTLAGALLASIALALAGAAPASAAPIEGQVHSSSSVQVGAGCDVDSGASSDTKAFTNRNDDRTADAVGTYTGTETGGDTVGASGSSAVTTRAYATARDRAFRRVKVSSMHVVALTNDSAVNCAMEVIGSSSGDAMLRIRERGRIRITWSSTGGDIELISLTNAAGTRGFERDPSANGSATMRVRRGLFSFSTSFRSSIREADVAEGDSESDVAAYAVTVTYLS